MDFVWNRVLANQVREATARTMTLQAEDMEKSAEQLLTAANNLDANIRTMEVDLRNATSDSARDSINRRISEARTRAAALRARARELNREAYELDSARRRTNELHAEMERMARATDGRYAAQLQNIKSEIGRYLNKMLELKNSMGIVSANGRAYATVGQLLMNPSFAPQWAWVNETLSRPAQDITPKQYATLAWFYSMQTSLAGQEKFINMLLEPMTLPSGIIGGRNANSFTICPLKMEGVQRFIDSGIGILFHVQTGFATNSHDYRLLQEERDRLKGLSALLTVVNSLTNHDVKVDTISGPIGVLQRVILGEGNSPHVRLSESVSGGTDIAASRGVIHARWTNEMIYEVDLQRINSNINISPVLGGAGMGRDHTIAATDYFYLKYQFDLVAYLGEGILNLALSATTWGAHDALTLGFDAMSLLAGTPSARGEAQSIQSDFRSFGTQALISDFYEHFGLRGVVVTEVGQTPQMLGWPTVSTKSALDALNSTFSEAVKQGELPRITQPNVAIPQTNFTWQQFLENPTAVFVAYSVLNGGGVDDWDTRAGTYYDARNEELREQATPQAESPRTENPQSPLPNLPPEANQIFEL